MYLTLSANCIRMPPVKLSDLDIMRPALNEFMATGEPIEEYSIQNRWCHILPRSLHNSHNKHQIVVACTISDSDVPWHVLGALTNLSNNTHCTGDWYKAKKS